MSDQFAHTRADSSDETSPFDALMASASPNHTEAMFATAFRGYDKEEVDRTVAGLNQRVRQQSEQIQELQDRHRRAGAINAQNRKSIERLEADLAAQGEHETSVARMESELAASNARLADAEKRVKTLSDQLIETTADGNGRREFDEVLRVAEEQASSLIRNATVQGERLLMAAREEIQNRRKEADVEAAAIVGQAQQEAQQARLKIETELTAHRAGIEREGAHAAEKVSQAEREAAAIRAEAEKGAAALRSMVARETAQSRAEAEEAVRELRVRALEFEASLSRRQDDAQQEFLVLHNQAVAHAERITADANDQVSASLEHAQRVAAKAEDFERLVRAQAQQVEADASMRSRETLDRARDKAQRIIDMVSTHSQAVLRDAEDRTRQLRWQQHQLTSFMAEVKELIRPEGAYDSTGLATDDEIAAADAFLADAAADASDDRNVFDAPDADADADAEVEEEYEAEVEDDPDAKDDDEIEGEVVVEHSEEHESVGQR